MAFGFRNGTRGDFNAGSQFALRVPAGWTVPQNAAPANPGYVSIVSTSGTATASILSVTGSGPWTVTVNFTAVKGSGNGFNVGYAGGGTQIVAPATTGTYAFAAQTKQSGGTLTAIGANPSVVVAKGNQAISFPAIGDQCATNRVELSATASSGLGVLFSVLSGPGSIAGNADLTFSGAGEVAIVASQPGNANWNPAPSVTQTFAVAKASAVVALADLEQTYDGTPRLISATTSPTGLSVQVAYDGLPTPPAAAGSHEVVATVNDSRYAGGATGTLVIAKAVAAISLGDLAQVYDGTSKSATALSTPAGLAVELTYDGAAAAPIAAGSHAVAAAVVDANYEGWASGTLVIAKAAAVISLGDLLQTYDGSPKSASAATVPPGLAVELTYDGSVGVPIAAGSHAVSATVVDSNYFGSAIGTLMVAKAGQSIDFPAIGNQQSTNAVVLAATASSGLPVGFALVNGPAEIQGTTVTFTGTGTVAIEASQAGDGNWEAASGVTRTFQVAKAPAAISLNGLSQAYDGSPRAVTASTEPAGLAVDIAYDGGSAVPVGVGSYAVVATVTHPMYFAATTGTLVVAKGAATVVLGDLDQLYDGEPKNASVSTLPAGLPVDIAYDGFPTPPANPGPHAVSAVVNDPNYAGSATGTLLVVPQVELEELEQVYDGNPKPVKTKTKPTNVTAIVTYDGHPEPPVNAGRYAVTAIVCHASQCHGKAAGILNVAKASQAIDFPAIGSQLATNMVALAATVSSGLPATFAVESGPAAIVDGAKLIFSDTGTVRVAASQSGDGNWNPASNVVREFAVSNPEVIPVFSSTAINVREAGEGRFFVRLNVKPATNVVLSIARSAGETNLAVQSGATRTFKPSNWSVWQAVTLAAGADGNTNNETATFRISAAGLADRFVEAIALDDDVATNLALASRGCVISGVKANQMAQLIDGVHNASTNYGYTVWTNHPSGTMTLDLKAVATVSRVRLLNWDWNYASQNYEIESSPDGTNWTPLVDARAQGRHGWDDWPVADVAARYLRFTGTSNSAGNYVSISELEVYGIPPPPPWLEFSAERVNVREGGGGRFYMRLTSAPESNVVVSVARSAGDANLGVTVGATRTFKPSNWNAWQSVSLAAGEDGNAGDEIAVFRASASGYTNRFVEAVALDDDIGTNLALAAQGSSITWSKAGQAAQVIDGVHTSTANYGYTIWTNNPPGTLTVDLKRSATVSRMRLLNWDGGYRVQRYKVESSENGASWKLLADASAQDRQGWDDWPVADQTVRYLRFTGLSNSAGSYACLSEWEVYGAPLPLQQPELSTTNVNVREGGSGRFFLRLTNAPQGLVTFTVARVAGDGISVSGGASRTFKPSNWSTWQAVTLAAEDDGNSEPESAVFRVSASGMADQFVEATTLDDDIGENLALAAGGAQIGWTKGGAADRLIDGIHNDSANYGYSAWTNNPPGTFTLDLFAAMSVSRVRLLNWDWSYRIQRYTIESSLDGRDWTMLVDARAQARHGWDDWPVDRPVRYLRFTALSNSANSYVCISELEIYGTRPAARRSLAPATGGSLLSESVPVTVLTSDGVEDETGWNALDGDGTSAWVGRKPGGGYVLAEYQPALELSALEVDLAEGSLTNVQYLYSADARNWQPLPDDMESNPVELNYLWLVFPDDGTGAVPRVLEIRPNP